MGVDLTKSLEVFSEEIKDLIERRFGENYSVSVKDIRKNNGVILKSLNITEKGVNVTPAIYLNDYYSRYLAHTLTQIEAVDEIMGIYSKHKSPKINAELFKDFDFVKSKIMYRVINRKKNEDIFDEVPHFGFLDLLVICVVVVEETDESISSFMVTNSHMKMWGINRNELVEAAEQNKRKQKVILTPIEDVLESLIEEVGADPSEIPIDSSLWVLTNERKLNGATLILNYECWAKTFSNRIGGVTGGDFYIIPSSIHELLLLPVRDDDNIDEIKDMIREINDTQVQQEEILSYSLYRYNRLKDEIVVL